MNMTTDPGPKGHKSHRIYQKEAEKTTRYVIHKLLFQYQSGELLHSNAQVVFEGVLQHDHH